MSGELPNGKEIVRGALGGGDTPRCAVGPLAVHFCAQAAGRSLRQYTLEPRVLADCVVQYYERFRPDAIWLSADTWVIAEAMGATVDFPDENQPLGGVGVPRIRSAADIDGIPPPDPATQGRFPLMLEALGRIHDAIGSEVYVVACFDQYPFSLACALMGIDAAMTKLIEDRPMLTVVMERGLEYGLAYARALAGAGADMLSGGDSPAGLIGPQLYREVALPYERRLVEGLKAHHAQPVSLHICGDATPILADMPTTGADVLELDHAVDIRQACRIVGPDVALWGNLDPVGVLAQSSPENVRRATHRLLETVQACGRRRFVLSSGCTLAVETPPENLHAMFQTAREFPLARTRETAIKGGVCHGR